MDQLLELPILPEAVVNRKYPHQVIIPSGKVGAEHRRFADVLGLSLCAQVGAVRVQHVAYRVFCFAERTDARTFAQHFNGIRYIAAVKTSPVVMVPVIGTIR